MSEELLDEALDAMKAENLDAAALDAARARVLKTVANAGTVACAEFRQDFRAYLANELPAGRRTLVEDHLSRCPSCRTALAEMKGERRVIEMPRRATSRWVRPGALAAAAALLLALAYLSRDTIDAMMGPGGPRATVVSTNGGVYRLAKGTLAAGAAIGEGEPVRTGPGAHAMLQLADGSMVDVNERTELYVTAAWSGQSIHLERGDVIVRAARQRRGHLRVLTRDSVASVKGTVFAVSAGMGGSVVSVVEGSVAVNHPGRQVLLKPGQQAASMPALQTSVAQAVSWSPDAEQYIVLLASFGNIEKELATLPTEMRTQSSLLASLPAGAIVYGAVPNPGITIDRAVTLAEEQSAQNATFNAWWNSETGVRLREMANRLQSVHPLLGDEIVFCANDTGVPGNENPFPMVMARVQPGKSAELTSALQQLFAATGGSSDAFSVSDDLMIVSVSAARVAWARAHVGQGASSPFAAAIADRYHRGVGWMIAVDGPAVAAMAVGDDSPFELARRIGLKYLFVEQRAPAGALENEITFTFEGARTGMGAWLADSGSGGAAEYLPPDAIVAGYVSTREPLRLFEDITAQLTKTQPDFDQAIQSLDDKLGAGFVKNLTAALGTEAAVAMTGFSTSAPTWIVAALANDPATIDSSLQKLVDTFNAQLPPDQQSKKIVLTQESASGRTWNTLRTSALPVGVTWTYDQGYMIAASDRASGERAIATRSAGTPLVWSAEFLGQLPSTAGLHPSAFGWLNPKGAAGLLALVNSSPKLRELVSSRDPILAVFDATSDQIHGASRARVTGLILDLMTLQTLKTPAVQQTDAIPRQ